METTLTRNQLGGRATGSIFFAGFGALWIALSLVCRQNFTFTTACGVGVGFAGLLQAALYLLRQARRWPGVPEDPAVGRAFGYLNAAQWILGGAVAYSLARLHLDAYIPCAIGAIVGLHLFPMARLFRYPLHNLTGGLLVAWAAASAAFVPADQLQSISALGTGMILWASAAVTLARNIQLARRNSPARLAMPARREAA